MTIGWNEQELRQVGEGWALDPEGDARGQWAVDLQTSRASSDQVASGSDSVIAGGRNNKANDHHCVISGGTNHIASADSATVSGGHTNTASGENSTVSGGKDNVASGLHNTVSGGYGNTAANATSAATVAGGAYNTATGAVAAVLGGARAVADKWGQEAFACGRFAENGDAQRSIFVLRRTTTNNTQTEMYASGDSSNAQMTIADDTAWAFRAEVVGITANAAKAAAFTVTGLVLRNNGTVSVAGVTSTEISNTPSWAATAVADDTNKALSIKVTGGASDTVRWVATVFATEVSFPG